MKEFVESKEFKNPLFNLKEEAMNITNMFYPGTYKVETEMNEDTDYDNRKKALKELTLKELDEMIDQNIDDFGAGKLKELYIDFIYDWDIDLKDEQ